MTSAEVQLSPRAARTRAALLAAGFDLLAMRPIDAIAIDDIVARAGVAKGSFFNHFVDKAGFATELGAQVRKELELRVTAANQQVTDPVARLAGGMRVALDFALNEQKRTIVMLRGLELSTGLGLHLNRGVHADMEAAVAAGLARPEARRSGVPFWLGLCQILLLGAIERELPRAYAAERLREMLVLGLTGLGVPQDHAVKTAAQVAGEL